MILTTNNQPYEHRIQQHAFFVQQKVRILVAFVAAMLFLCVENVKAFTAPLSNPDALLFMASGAHSVAKRWRSKPATLNTRLRTNQPAEKSQEQNFQTIRLQPQPQILRSQRNSLTSLRMAFAFGASVTKERPPTLDMKTSINAFGSWYNKMDPVARPPDYDDDETDYSLSSPADDWPSSLDEELLATSTATFSTGSRNQSKSFSSERKRPHPIRTIRKIAGWFLASSPVRNTARFRSQNFL